MPAILQAIFFIFSSRLIQSALIFAIAFGWGSLRENQSWKIKIAQQNAAAEAAYKIELEREKAAGAQIQLDAEKRRLSDQSTIEDMQRVIDEAAAEEKQPTQSKLAPCRIDSSFTRWVQRIDTAANRKTKSTRRSRRFR